MAKLNYSIRVCLSEQQIADLPRSTITTQQQVAKVRDFSEHCNLGSQLLVDDDIVVWLLMRHGTI